MKKLYEEVLDMERILANYDFTGIAKGDFHINDLLVKSIFKKAKGFDVKEHLSYDAEDESPKEVNISFEDNQSDERIEINIPVEIVDDEPENLPPYILDENFLGMVMKFNGTLLVNSLSHCLKDRCWGTNEINILRYSYLEHLGLDPEEHYRSCEEILYVPFDDDPDFRQNVHNEFLIARFRKDEINFRDFFLASAHSVLGQYFEFEKMHDLADEFYSKAIKIVDYLPVLYNLRACNRLILLQGSCEKDDTNGIEQILEDTDKVIDIANDLTEIRDLEEWGDLKRTLRKTYEIRLEVRKKQLEIANDKIYEEEIRKVIRDESILYYRYSLTKDSDGSLTRSCIEEQMTELYFTKEEFREWFKNRPEYKDLDNDGIDLICDNFRTHSFEGRTYHQMPVKSDLEDTFLNLEKDFFDQGYSILEINNIGYEGFFFERTVIKNEREMNIKLLHELFSIFPEEVHIVFDGHGQSPNVIKNFIYSNEVYEIKVRSGEDKRRFYCMSPKFFKEDYEEYL